MGGMRGNSCLSFSLSFSLFISLTRIRLRNNNFVGGYNIYKTMHKGHAFITFFPAAATDHLPHTRAHILNRCPVHNIIQWRLK